LTFFRALQNNVNKQKPLSNILPIHQILKGCFKLHVPSNCSCEKALRWNHPRILDKTRDGEKVKGSGKEKFLKAADDELS